ncbi:MAG: hypothetical protein GOMPHAMPRED_008050 [Gomphillus americanus]|uniref:Gamma-glutamyltranspeptidase n=1 Tax=Gomphillus americanus TaxID=1940652 RepID=A0A8H3IFF5_9LECA|nr:MAG: hypothetical protein GOMPHAMPRED_008050 [Gomphillus americanus]
MAIGRSSVFPQGTKDRWFQSFASRRSTVHSTKGIIACTQPLAAAAGQRILAAGGNAADAAVAIAAAMNMTEPCSTGIGGDMFCLFYDAKTKQVKSLNGSGRSAASLSLDDIRKHLNLQDGKAGEIPFRGVLSVTIPGAAAGWVDTVDRFGSGKVSLSEILQPAIELGERGFPVSETTACNWHDQENLLKTASPNGNEMLKDGKAPKAGELFFNTNLAKTFRLVGEKGKSGFYEGRVAEALVQVVSDLGGHITLEDLKAHSSTGTENTEPLSLTFSGQNATKHGDDQGIKLWEHPPNGQGLVALMALGILQILEKQGKIATFSQNDHNTAPYLHALIESLRIAFADGNWFISDPNVSKLPLKELISETYLTTRAALFSPDKAISSPIDHGEPTQPFRSPAHAKSDTVYFSTTDARGNACSFINSNYAGFGTGIIPRGCGFTLQNRGANFLLQPADHPNIYAPSKRPYHTIIPAMLTNASDNSLHSTYGVMGGYMQPQGHIQVLFNMLVANLSPQEALDAPRFCISVVETSDAGTLPDNTVHIEEGISNETIQALRKLGHTVKLIKGWERQMFGRGQLIRVSEQAAPHGNGTVRVYSAGSDPRSDGMAVPAL